MQKNDSNLATKGMLAEPGDHFKGRYEVERKFWVEDLARFEALICQQGAIPFTIGNSETDIFFDLPDGRLEANNQFHTLRHMLPSDRVLWISKGPAKDECIAMDLPDFDKAAAMLTSLGYGEVRRISKNRDIYFFEDFHITLDDVKGLGTFVELAVMTDEKDDLPILREKVQLAAEKLKLTQFTEETRSYRQLLFG